MPREFDFVREARLMKALGERLRAAGHARILVPQPVSALTSQRLLVMQRMHGAPCRRDRTKPLKVCRTEPCHHARFPARAPSCPSPSPR